MHLDVVIARAFEGELVAAVAGRGRDLPRSFGSFAFLFAREGADMLGDIDPIKAAHAGLNLADELTMHYGLLPRANRGIFAINELPDLAGKIQVGLFNILQEGDVQIKGYPIRLELDLLMVFTANPEDYTAR